MESQAIDTLKRELAQKRAEATALEQAIAVLTGSAILIADSNGNLPQTNDFEGLGIVGAAKRFIKETGGTAKSTREIADTILRRGVETKSKNFVATVYSTLDNSKEFTRTPDGNWQIKDNN